MEEETSLKQLFQSLFLIDQNSSQNKTFTITIRESQISIHGKEVGDIEEIKNTIYDVFSCLKKDDLFGIMLDEIQTRDKNRIPHIISVLYLLHIFAGKQYRQAISQQLRGKYADGYEDYKHFDFAVLILALCHDLGYVYEKKDNENREQCHIDKNDLRYLIHLFELCKDCELPQYVTPEMLHNYLIYRNFSDHGILGAIDFWKKTKTLVAEHQNNSHYPEKLYYYVASLILVHNIWFCYQGKNSTAAKYEMTRKKYEDLGLNHLILETDDNRRNIPKISPLEDALLFLFILVDTLDPIKYALQNEVNMNVRIRLYDNDIIIDTDNIPYLEKMEDINNWLVDARLHLCSSTSKYSLKLTMPNVEQ